MKYLSFVAMLLLIGLVSNAMAAGCSDAYATAGVEGDIKGKQILATGPAPGNEGWNEDHCDSGALYKVAAEPAVDPKGVDPRAFRGNWTMSDSNVTYNYTVGGSSSYTWTLWKDTTTGGLCWEGSSGTIIAIAPAPVNAGAPCNIP